MSNLQDDIIKYKNGQLTAGEMHALEKKALSDPFLADALEGLDTISSENLTKDITDLNQKILKPKTILFTPWRIAAGVILIAASIIVFYQLPKEPKTIALQKEKPSAPAKGPNEDSIAEAQKEKAFQAEKVASEKAEQKAKGLIADREKEKHKQAELDKNAVATNTAPKTEIAKPLEEKQVEVADAEISSAPEKKSEEIKTEPKEAPVSIAMQPVQQELVKDEDSKKEKASSRARKFAAKSEVASGVAVGASAANPKRITGKVTSADDGSPLPGVNVIVAGTTQGTVTDTQGNFSLQSSSENQKLVFSFIGLEAQEIDIEGKDRVDVSLKTDASQLSEVVVTGYSVAKRDDDAEPDVKSASPVGGMRAYNKYLDASVRYPQQALENNIKGKVKVEFSVKADGSLDDYKVVKSLGYGCDEEVIRLIKEGPRWSPSTENGRPVEATVLVGVKFDPAKAGR